jgi:hypothetical protein
VNISRALRVLARVLDALASNSDLNASLPFPLVNSLGLSTLLTFLGLGLAFRPAPLLHLTFRVRLLPAWVTFLRHLVQRAHDGGFSL